MINENITSLMNEVDVDDNAILNNEYHDNVVLENVVIDIEVNENENRAISLNIVVFRKNIERQVVGKDLGDVDSDEGGYDTYSENDNDSDSSFRESDYEMDYDDDLLFSNNVDYNIEEDGGGIDLDKRKGKSRRKGVKGSAIVEDTIEVNIGDNDKEIGVNLSDNLFSF